MICTASSRLETDEAEQIIYGCLRNTHEREHKSETREQGNS